MDASTLAVANATALSDPDVRGHFVHLARLDPDAQLELLLQWLRWGEGACGAAAMAFCRGVGSAMTDYLIVEALAEGKPRPYRLEVIDAIGRIGLTLTAEQYFMLSSARLAAGADVARHIGLLLGRLAGARWDRAARAEGVTS